ncbi:ABC transporter substrate-binding protein [Paracoccus sp. 1_MG-2023]|uniref:ABC transporter substrate-binding protein n=1 Tax=unclassified Paracoccus (in: a-proteobacteria) TaxID=2688777 RepID=UPI001C095FB4|nr:MULTISPECIES: ABC transporter substrate-binding protein [unclassified Paracoccus (in: a-proteobacteria)]MBU2956063.1 ABC transporter substrate-binding protein [Paracoccus sp. C2R09]MDO6669469.1 ABC transporter substrate-binding protein [Paracoccus sp. 1_MG-2023]
MTMSTRIAAAASAITMIAAIPASAEVLFWSTQARPAEEAQAMRQEVLGGFEPGVDYQPNEDGPWLTRLQAEDQAGSGSIGVLGALHGNFSAIDPDKLVDLGDMGITASSETFNSLAKLGTDTAQYVPWMQASYIMAASRQALDYLPEGADIDALTYDQLIEWSANVHEATGEPKFGFPAGPKGLKHRFFEGYLYPSYTDGVVRTFASPEAVTAWEKFSELWEHTNPASTNFSFMQEQLLSGDAWIVFDHTSRLAQAFNERPDDFVAFPAPAGPAGRGFMPVLAGMAIPETAPDKDEARALVEYMMTPEAQIATLRATSFFPVIDVELPDDLPPAVKAAGDAVAKMSAAEDANPGLLPSGLGDRGGDFDRVFNDTFERIILAGQPIEAVLQDQKTALQRVMEETGAPCWAPDAPSEGACPVE